LERGDHETKGGGRLGEVEEKATGFRNTIWFKGEEKLAVSPRGDSIPKKGKKGRRTKKGMGQKKREGVGISKHGGVF